MKNSNGKFGKNTQLYEWQIRKSGTHLDRNFGVTGIKHFKKPLVKRKFSHNFLILM